MNQEKPIDEAMSSHSNEEKPRIRKFAFNITKADRIFDFLLQEGQIKLSPNHVIPSTEELKKIKYCKWHNAMSHSTNECKVFRQQLQMAIESGRIKFDNSKAQKPMKIDQHPFPANMLDAKGKTKVLTSKTAEKNALVDPRHQVTTDDAKGKGLIKEGSSSGRPPRSGVVTTHRRHRETWQQHEISIGVNKRRGSTKNRIDIKITGIARSSFIVGNKISNCRLSETVLSAMDIIGMIDQITDSRTMIDALMSRSGGECQFMISWGADLVCMTDLVNMLVIF